VSALSTQPRLFDAPFIGQAVRSACVDELGAIKPGNVSIHAAGHGMRAQEFIRSADAIAPAMIRPGMSVGDRILAAVVATRTVVDCNTNLGIVMLCAPLVHTALQMRPGQTLRTELAKTLRGLDERDARLAYLAIRMAKPGGLGRVDEHDVGNERPQVTLFEAMCAASSRDRVAFQYANNYADIFENAIPRLRSAMRRWSSLEWAVVATYLGLLADIPDTHVKRKFGGDVAKQLSAEAADFEKRITTQANPAEILEELAAFDKSLKQKGINPGTTADLVVAALTVIKLQDHIQSAGVIPVRGKELAQVAASLPVSQLAAT